MDRRKFLMTGVALAGTRPGFGLANHEDLDPTLKEVESSHLTLTPKSSDRWELDFKRRRDIRILQVTDTHFSSTLEKDRLTIATLDALIRVTNPDLIVHTGDFVNNDSKNPVTWVGVQYFNQLKRPWTLCFGNHDYPVANSPGSLSLEDFRKSMNSSAMGYVDLENERHYCYRHDLMAGQGEPAASFFYFQVGYSAGMRKIFGPQLSWFETQMKTDKEKGWKSPILVFVHIPLIEFNALVNSGKSRGFKNEDVHFDSDTGDSFKAFAASERVKGVFCGHDHVNNFHGDWQGIGLHYGRVSGWGGYGKWSRGGRLISVDPVTGQFSHREIVV